MGVATTAVTADAEHVGVEVDLRHHHVGRGARAGGDAARVTYLDDMMLR